MSNIFIAGWLYKVNKILENQGVFPLGLFFWGCGVFCFGFFLFIYLDLKLHFVCSNFVVEHCTCHRDPACSSRVGTRVHFLNNLLLN